MTTFVGLERIQVSFECMLVNNEDHEEQTPLVLQCEMFTSHQ